MKTFKHIDLWISAGLIIICAVVVVYSQSISYLLTSYFIIGAWQVTSMIVHVLNNWFMKKGGSRSFYHWLTLTIIGVSLLGFVLKPLLIIFYFLLFASPFFAAWYAIICYAELKELKMSHSLNLK